MSLLFNIPNKENKYSILSAFLLVAIFIDRASFNNFLLPSIVLLSLLYNAFTISENKLNACNFAQKNGYFLK